MLKWHQVGCYAVAFSDISMHDEISETSRQIHEAPPSESASRITNIAQRGINSLAKGNMSVKDRRIHQAKTAHWIAAGAKDGKISLWDIY